MDRVRKPRLMDQVRRVLRVKHYSVRTEKAYCYWIRYFIRYNGMRHPAEMGVAGIRGRYTDLPAPNQYTVPGNSIRYCPRNSHPA